MVVFGPEAEPFSLGGVLRGLLRDPLLLGDHSLGDEGSRRWSALGPYAGRGLQAVFTTPGSRGSLAADGYPGPSTGKRLVKFAKGLRDACAAPAPIPYGVVGRTKPAV